MDNYIKCYENAVTNEFCDDTITKFESSYTEHEEWPVDKPFFTQINLQKSGLWNGEISYLKDVFEKYIKIYKKECEIDNNQWPDSFGLEPFRIKRYLPDGQNFPPHVDVNTKNNCSRFLAFFLYLTNNEKGGTVFPSISDIVSPCRQGSLLMFPGWLEHGVTQNLSNEDRIVISFNLKLIPKL